MMMPERWHQRRRRISWSELVANVGVIFGIEVSELLNDSLVSTQQAAATLLKRRHCGRAHGLASAPVDVPGAAMKEPHSGFCREIVRE